MKSCLEAPDRWQVQAAERVTVEINPEQLVIVQQQVVSPPFLKLWRLTALKCSSCNNVSRVGHQPEDAFACSTTAQELDSSSSRSWVLSVGWSICVDSLSGKPSIRHICRWVVWCNRNH